MAKNNLKSFTLIELLIVIAIIAIIAAVIIASTGSSRISARDSRRIQDLKELQTALEFYYDDNKKYPDISTGCCIESSSEFKDALVPDYISTLPKDPTYPDQCYFYRSSADASYYKIFAKMEESGNKAAENDGGTLSNYFEVYAPVAHASELTMWYVGGVGETGTWSHRKKITIDNTGNTQDIYLTRISVQYKCPSSGANNEICPASGNFNDVRFAASDAKTPLNFWREDYNENADADFWVEIDEGIPGGSNGDIYIYYQNSSASYTGSLESVFGSDLVAFWPFDEGSGDNADDKSGNGNNGELIDLVKGLHGEENPPAWKKEECRFGSCLYFDGNGAVANVDDSPSSSLDSLNQNFTIELWVNPHTTEKAILGKEIDSSDLHFSYWYYDGDQELFLNSTSYYIKGDSTIPTDTWTHIAVTRDGSQFQLYENGEAASTDLANSPGNADLSNNDESLYIGGTHINTSYCFQGYLDEIRIYNRTLSPSEIKKHSSPPPTGISFGTQE